MSATAENLRQLHGLHQQAKALRDLMASAPKTLAARESALAARRAKLDAAKKARMDAQATVKRKEMQLQSISTKGDDLRVKLNQTRKQDEYNAIVSQLNLDGKTKAKLEDEILDGMAAGETQDAEVAAIEAEVKTLEADVERLRAEIAERAEGQKVTLAKLDAAIREAEAVIPEDQRETYRRVLTRRADDAMASVEGGACTGCYTSTTAQMINELINGGQVVFCKSCGRILYLAEEDRPNLRRTKSK